MNKERLYVWPIAVLAGMVFLVSNLLWLFPFIEDVRMGAARYQEEIANRVANQIQFFLEQRLRELSSLTIELSGIDNATTTAATIASFLERNPDFLDIVILPRVGQLDVGQILNQEGFLNPVFATRDGRKATFMRLPFDGKDLRGLIDLGRFIRWARDERVGRNGFIYILDLDNNVIYHPNEELLTKDQLAIRSVLSFRASGGVLNQEGREVTQVSVVSDSYLNEKGEEVFAVAVTLANIGWVVVAEAPIVEAWANQFYAIALALGLIFIGVIFVIILVINFRKIISVASREMALNRSKSEYISLLAHQLRSPLTNIKWNLDTLIKKDWGPLTGDQKKFLERSLDANEKMIITLRELLDVIDLEEGKVRLQLKVDDLVVLVKEVVDKFKSHAEGEGIGLQIVKAPESLLVEMDRSKMVVVISNIVDNAIRYNKPGGRVDVVVDHKDGNALVEITDTGFGLSKEESGRLFEKFFRSHKATRVNVEGFGLGLYIARNIVDKHGGKIEVASEIEKGTTLSIILPIK